MPRYMLTTHGPTDAPPSDTPPAREITPEQLAEAMGPITALEDDMRAQGAWVFSARLDTPRAATVVRDRDGDTVATDGPYLESKEQAAGFYLIDADDDRAARRWAARVAATIGNHIELRRLADWAQ